MLRSSIWKETVFWVLKKPDSLRCSQNQDAAWEKNTFARPVEPRKLRKYVYLLVERLVVVVGWPTTLKGYDYELLWRKLWCIHRWRKLLLSHQTSMSHQMSMSQVLQGRTPALICLKHYAAWGSGMPKLLWSKQGGGKQSQGPCSRRSTLTVVEVSEVNHSVTASSSASWINIGSSQK